MILERIVQHKRDEVREQRARVPQSMLLSQIRDAQHPRPFRKALLQSPHPVSLIAEVKRASPSKGLIRSDFDPVSIATTYAAHGATAISVLTDEAFFQGSLEYLRQIRLAVDIPLLRKEFIIDPYQIYESRAASADAILLIVACLEPTQLSDYMHLATELGLDVLVEVHDEAELEIAVQAKANLIGINNRNLKTFETTLNVTKRLGANIPSGVPFVSESGIFTREHVLEVGEAGARSILVGESLMRQADMGAHIRNILGLGVQSGMETRR